MSRVDAFILDVCRQSTEFNSNTAAAGFHQSIFAFTFEILNFPRFTLFVFLDLKKFENFAGSCTRVAAEGTHKVKIHPDISYMLTCQKAAGTHNLHCRVPVICAIVVKR